MIDLNDVPVIDHHCHTYTEEFASVSPERLARLFHHGFGDVYDPAVKKEKQWGRSDELFAHFPHMGVVKTLICKLSETLDCSPDLESVTEARNKMSSLDFSAYVRFLYEDVGICGTVIDSSLPADNAPEIEYFHGKKLRLFSLDPILDDLIKQYDSYADMMHELKRRLEEAVTKYGFIGVKAHLAEQAGFDAEPVWEKEASLVYGPAKNGDLRSFEKLYVAVFTEMMMEGQRLNIPIHLHSGCTGSVWKGAPIHGADPFKLAQFLRRKEFVSTKVVILHAAYPWTREAGQMVHCLPNLWVDLSVMMPWASLSLCQNLREIMAWAPHSKIMVGTGGHGSPEIAYLGAKTVKTALTEVLDDSVRLGFLSEEQAIESARMILHDNAARLYNLTEN